MKLEMHGKAQHIARLVS